nr:MAG TPA: hypothetical protein [Caudoviricetes sp.]
MLDRLHLPQNLKGEHTMQNLPINAWAGEFTVAGEVRA